MRRTIEIVIATIAAIVLIELLLQIPLYRWLQPAILFPAEGAVVTAPLRVQWDGPPRMMVVLAADGEPAQALGLQPSPYELGSAALSVPGMYRLRVQAPLLGTLIQAERRFVVAAAPVQPVSPPPTAPDPRLAQLTASLSALQAAQEQTQGENASLREEIATLHQENAALLADIERGTKTQEEDAARDAAQSERLAQLTQDNQALSERLGVTQWQLNAALACRVWGYYAFPRPQTYPPTRRTIIITNGVGEIFRSEAECEGARVADPTTASRCFCPAAPWGG